MQEVIALPAVQGKQIQIDSVYMKLCTEKYGYIASAMVTIETGGIEKKVAEWTSKAASDELKTTNLTFVAPVEQSVTIYYHLKTSSSAYKAIARTRGCTYTLIDAPTTEPEEPDEQEGNDDTVTEPEKPARVQIICGSQQDAKNLVEDLRAHIGERTIEIYTKVQ